VKEYPSRAEALEAAGIKEWAMSQENVELVKRFEESWAASDLQTALECVHPEMEFDWSDSMGPFAGMYRGLDGLTRFWTEMLEAWEHFAPEMEEVIDIGPDRLITLDVVRGRGRGSGVDIEARGAMLWSFRDGKIARAKMFQTKDEALAAADLSAQGPPRPGPEPGPPKPPLPDPVPPTPTPEPGPPGPPEPPRPI
jgi:ketosteroid isomerase-like protein